MKINNKSTVLKAAMFATGLSGIVAECILSTLATYFLGDSVLQWTMTMSVMMFAMGVGSRVSKLFKKNLLRKFLCVEFFLSIAVAFSSILVYTAAAYTEYTAFIIYIISIFVGLFIGMEIPLVIRINEENETLRSNVSSIMEQDYYGSLIGGIFFAFIGLPFLGLTYTPFVLGLLNFTVAIVVLAMLWKQQSASNKRVLGYGGAAVFTLIMIGLYFAKPIILYGEQNRYKDKIVYEEQSRYQKIVITKWHNDHWLFLDGNQQLSSFDEALYHEPLVHPAMQLVKHPQNVLILGGGDGCAAREVFKYPSVKSIDIVDIDPAMTLLGQKNPIIVDLNKNAMNDARINIINQDAYKYLEDIKTYYDVIIIDLTDPKTVELGRLYSQEFYSLCNRHLRPNGIIITQAGSPYYAIDAFNCIKKTVAEAGFGVIPMHNQVLTMGEWGWIIGSKALTSDQLKTATRSLTFDNVETEWINNDAMLLITSFGKDFYDKSNKEIRVNKIHDPVLYKYYLEGHWEIY